MRVSLSNILGCLGVVASAIGCVQAGRTYIALGQARAQAASLVTAEDVVTPKIEILLGGHQAKDLVIGELKNRSRESESLLGSVITVTEDGRRAAKVQGALWVLAGVFFTALWARAERRPHPLSN